MFLVNRLFMLALFFFNLDIPAMMIFTVHHLILQIKTKRSLGHKIGNFALILTFSVLFLLQKLE